MALNPFLGMNREQLDHTRVLLQLAAALGSFEAAFEALDSCQGDEQIDIKLWELSPEQLDKLADVAERLHAASWGEGGPQAVRRRSSQACDLTDGPGQCDSKPPAADEDRHAG